VQPSIRHNEQTKFATRQIQRFRPEGMLALVWEEQRRLQFGADKRRKKENIHV